MILSRIVQTKGIVIALLGVVHIVVSYFEYEKIITEMSKEMAREYILWFNAVGLFIMFIGFIDIISFKGIKQQMNWAWKISLLSATFAFITGLSGVIGFNFIPSPPYLILLSGIVSLIPLLLFKKEFINHN